MKNKGLQRQLAELFDIDTPMFSKLVCTKIQQFSLLTKEYKFIELTLKLCF